MLDFSSDARGGSGALCHTRRDVFGTLRAARDVNTIGHRRDWVEFGMSLDIPTRGTARDTEELPNFFRVVAWLKTCRENDHVHRDASLFADERIFRLNDQFALFARQARGIRHFGDATAHKERPFLENALIKFVIVFERRANVHVKIVDLCARTFLDNVRELETLHAADRRAVVVIVLVATADAVNNANRLRYRNAVAQHNFAVGRTRRVGKPLKFQTGEHIRQSSIAILRDTPSIEQFPTGG